MEVEAKSSQESSVFSCLPAKMISESFQRLAGDPHKCLFFIEKSQIYNMNASGIFIVNTFHHRLDFFLLDHADHFPAHLLKSVDVISKIGILLASARSHLFRHHQEFYYNASFFIVVRPADDEAWIIPTSPAGECGQPPIHRGLVVKLLDKITNSCLECEYQFASVDPPEGWYDLYQHYFYDSAATEAGWIANNQDVEPDVLIFHDLVVLEGSVFLDSQQCFSDTTTTVASISNDYLMYWFTSFLAMPDPVSFATASLSISAAAITAGEQEKDGGELLPYDVLLEIFSYLPAKMILQLQLLSKSFRHLSSLPCFRQLQSQRNNVAASGVFVFGKYVHQLDFFLLDHTAGLPWSFLQSLEEISWNAVLLTSSRGILFYRRRYGVSFIVAANPVCNEVRIIPAPPSDKYSSASWPYYGLAVKFLDEDNPRLKCGFQLVYLRPPSPGTSWSNFYQCCLYDSTSREWIVIDQQVDLGPDYIKLDDLILLEGSIFLVAKCLSNITTSAPYVVSYDISTRLVKFLAVPESIASEEDKINVAIWEEVVGERSQYSYLCLAHYDKRSHKFVLWRWYSKGSIWVKFQEVVLDRRRHGEDVHAFYLCNGAGAIKGTGMLLLFNADDRVYAYCFERREFLELGRTKFDIVNFLVYSNSLQPCRSRR